MNLKETVGGGGLSGLLDAGEAAMDRVHRRLPFYSSRCHKKDLNMKGKLLVYRHTFCTNPLFLGNQLAVFFFLLLLLLHVLINSSIIRSLSAAEILSSGSRTKSVSISRQGS